MVVSAGCPYVHPAIAPNNTIDRLIPSIDSPPVAQESKQSEGESEPGWGLKWLISRGANHFDAEVRAQGFGHNHAAVGLLIVFEDGDPGASDCQATAVQSVHEIGGGAGF